MNLNHIAFRDDPFLFWRFNVSDNFIDVIKRDENQALEKLYAFFTDYIELSEKYQLGEIFPLSNKNHSIENRKREYINFCKSHYLATKSITFFPLKDSRHLELRGINALHPSSCSYTFLNFNGEKVEDYLFINRNQITRQSSYNLTKLPSSQENFEIQGFGVLSSNKKQMTKEDLGFSLSIYSEFWFERAFYGSGKNWKNGIDNKVNSKLNTPRLNSFLRDLKQLWIKKYNWELGDFEGWYKSNENGILIDNRIIYVEDTP